MITGFPILIELVMERLAAFARVFAAVKLLAVRFEDESAFVVIELIVHVALARRKVEEQLVTAGVLGFDGIRSRNSVVV